jgi:hypothetical protein
MRTRFFQGLLFVSGRRFPQRIRGISDAGVPLILNCFTIKHKSKIVNRKNPNEPEATMIHVTAKAAAYIAARGGDLTLYSKTLSG